MFTIDLTTGEIKTATDFSKLLSMPHVLAFLIQATCPTYEKQYDCASVIVSFSRWIINRNGGHRASATTSGSGCTIAELADIIGLHKSEFRKWLTVINSVDGGSSSGSSGSGSGNTPPEVTIILSNGTTTTRTLETLQVDDKLTANQEFRIPNTIVAAYFGDEGRLTNWTERCGEILALGFRIEMHTNDYYGIGGSPYYDKMLTMWNETKWRRPGDWTATGDHSGGVSPRSNESKYYFNNKFTMLPGKALHGFFLYGHGGKTDFGTSIFYGNYAQAGAQGQIIEGMVASIGPPVRITYAHVSSLLKYRLGAVILYVCLGNAQDGEGKSLVSESEGCVFEAEAGVVSPSVFADRTIQSLFPNGKQGTNIIE
jgi:hypothetical protein